MSLFSLFGCGKKTIKLDLTTPEAAILSLEDAYRKADVELAVACKDFKVEAAYMVRDKPPMQDEAIIAKLAGVLELAYREQMKGGFPDMSGVTSTFPKKRDYGDSMVVVTEVCLYPDGGTSQQDMLVAKTDAGWKVLIPIK